MLGLERRIVAALTTADDPAVRSGVATWVEETLQDMPEHLRLGVAVQSVVLGLWASTRPGDDAALLASFERSPLWPVRQYVRLFKGLVLFAEQELTDRSAVRS